MIALAVSLASASLSGFAWFYIASTAIPSGDLKMIVLMAGIGIIGVMGAIAGLQEFLDWRKS